MLPRIDSAQRTSPELWIWVGLYLTVRNVMANDVKIPKPEMKAIIWLASPMVFPKVWAISIRRTLTIREVA